MPGDPASIEHRLLDRVYEVLTALDDVDPTAEPERYAAVLGRLRREIRRLYPRLMSVGDRAIDRYRTVSEPNRHEILQEAFVRLIATLRTWQPATDPRIDNVEGYFWTVVRNLCAAGHGGPTAAVSLDPDRIELLADRHRLDARGLSGAADDDGEPPDDQEWRRRRLEGRLDHLLADLGADPPLRRSDLLALDGDVERRGLQAVIDDPDSAIHTLLGLLRADDTRRREVATRLLHRGLRVRFPDLAAVSGVPVGTLRSWNHRAGRRLDLLDDADRRLELSNG